MGFFILVLAALFLIGVFEVIFVETERYGRATLLFLATGVALQFLCKVPIWQFVRDHYGLALAYLGCYILAGLVWSFFKWYLYLLNFRNEYVALRDKFCKRKNIPVDSDLSEQQRADLLASIGYNYQKVPSAGENKARITGWMIFWVFSAIGWLLNDPFRRLANFVFNLFKGTFQRIADRMFRNFPELK